jgi:hypothetical protein
MLVDVADGVMSLLEHAYLVRVERAHGLPRGSRQRPASTSDGRAYRDVEYETFGLIVELDGGLWHGQRALLSLAGCPAGIQCREVTPQGRWLVCGR